MAAISDQKELGSSTELPDRWSFGQRLMILVVVQLVAFLVTWSVAFLTGGPSILAAACIAAGICFLASVLGHVVSEFPRGETFLTGRLLATMVVRVGIPMALLVVLKMNNSPLMDKGIVYFVVLFYVVGLATDLVLHYRKFQWLSVSSDLSNKQ